MISIVLQFTFRLLDQDVNTQVNNKYLKKSKFLSLFNQALNHENVWGKGGRDPRIRNLLARWRPVAEHVIWTFREKAEIPCPSRDRRPIPLSCNFKSSYYTDRNTTVPNK
jgi:hypothetical protein